MCSRTIVYKKYISIGVAVDTERGLLVPVIRDADKKDITEISVELTDISSRARGEETLCGQAQGRHLHHNQPWGDRGGLFHSDS